MDAPEEVVLDKYCISLTCLFNSNQSTLDEKIGTVAFLSHRRFARPSQNVINLGNDSRFLFKSLGHALGPTVIVESLGIGSCSNKAKTRMDVLFVSQIFHCWKNGLLHKGFRMHDHSSICLVLGSCFHQVESLGSPNFNGLVGSINHSIVHGIVGKGCNDKMFIVHIIHIMLLVILVAAVVIVKFENVNRAQIHCIIPQHGHASVIFVLYRRHVMFH
mmetsp:Transcript_22281/g.55038  ORF Transcript_22281/g.55038 Transcript_22281/m.55038 type:complete len:217 (+) Transcript_22281:376-1026(+)